MHNDDMDDAEFDAFLKGEGPLARRMKAVAQPSPSAELDAAILARATLDMAREPRPAAANDAGAGAPAPKLGRGLGWRWRVPAGIAATVLAGVVANQSWRANEAAKANDPVLDEAPAAIPGAPAPVEAPPALQAAAPAAAPAPMPAPKQRAALKPAPAADLARPAPPAAAAAAPDRTDSFAGLPAPAPPAPPPPVEPEASVHRRQADAELRKELVAESNKTAAAKLSRMGAASEIVTITGSANRALQPQAWLEQIEALRKAGREDEALQQWTIFRAAHPDYPVPPSMLEHFKPAR